MFPFLNSATTLLSGGLQRYLSSPDGMSEELAFRVAYTISRVPVTAVLCMLVAASQCAVVRDVRPWALRWIAAATAGACISTLIYLPSTLVALQVFGNISDGIVRMFLLVVPGAGLLAGIVSFLQRRTARRNVVAPGWFVAASVVAAMIGVIGGSQFA